MRGLLLLTVAGMMPGAARAGDGTPGQADFVERRVRPVLVENCVRCHGPKKQMGGLRLDSRDALLKGGDNGPVVEPGRPEKSLLIQAVRRGGELKMPPKKALPPQAVADLTAWVKMGAPWPDAAVTAKPKDADAWKRHWAFQPVREPAPPAIRHKGWPRTSVDPFILARLEAKGLTPSAAADRRTLLRRVTFDLTGLPPTPEEVEAFEADRSPDAFARVVDRLLASPHYGERWGRHWLDVARYSDTKGYVFFEEKEFPWAYTYRDYVVRAFNEDLPYDQFVVQQLAADRLPLGADRRPLTALGFLSLGGRFMNNVHDILDDRIDVTMRGLQGLTVSCARCHDHKFDPIPQKDYYALYGVFAGSVEPAVPPLFFDPPRTPEYERFTKELGAREGKLTEFLRARRKQVIDGARVRVADYLQAAHAMRGRPSTEEFMLIADGNDLNPTMVVRWQAYLSRARKRKDPVFGPWHQLAALPAKDFPARAHELLTRLAAPGPGQDPVNPVVVQALTARPPASMADVVHRYGELLAEADKLWRQALRRAAAAKLPAPTAIPDAAREQLRRVLYGPGSVPESAGEFNDLELLPDRPAQGQLQSLRKAVEEWRAKGPGAPPRAMVLVDAPTPYRPRVFLRGNPNNLGEVVSRHFPTVLAGPDPPPFTHGSGRLDLARAIADPRNPLTARVMVNRVWQHHFGQGLVRTPSDFGLRSEPPSHPELLDHLAATFVKHGWSVKKLHRLILLSATYQQRSDDRPGCRRVDPENLLLWKMNRQRLDFESTRDALLAVAGRLDRRLGGPPVREVLAASSTRRTVYGFIDRLQLPGLFRSFDFPSPDASSPRRDSTTVPQQALFLMNNPFVLECARGVLRRPEVAAEKDVSARVGRVYRLLYGRRPAAGEVGVAREFLGKAPGPVAWERYAQALLLANEFVFVD